MTQPIQSQPVPLLTHVPAASLTPSADPEATRLLRLWVDLTRRVAAAAAHRHGDERSLRRMQLQVEAALTRQGDTDALMAELWVWEAGLLHWSETPPETCLICRKARLGLPDLPLPARIGGAR